jgi:hypothetical protein
VVASFSVGGPGPEQMKRIAKSLKDAGNAGLRTELRKSVREAAKPLVGEIKRSAVLTLPGDLGKHVAAKGGITARTNINNAGIQVSIKGSTKRQLKRINAGMVRHPLYGNRKHWFWNDVPEGFWDVPIDRSGPRTRRAVMKAVTTIAKKVR